MRKQVVSLRAKTLVLIATCVGVLAFGLDWRPMQALARAEVGVRSKASEVAQSTSAEKATPDLHGQRGTVAARMDFEGNAGGRLAESISVA